MKKRYALKGLDYRQVVALLGKPEGADSLHLTYTLRLEYGLNSDPMYVKNLELQLDSNAKVVEYEVKEYEPE